MVIGVFWASFRWVLRHVCHDVAEHEHQDNRSIPWRLPFSGLALITAAWFSGAHLVGLVVAAALAGPGFALVRQDRLRWLGAAAFTEGASPLILA
jgi:hypothetical protein